MRILFFHEVPSLPVNLQYIQIVIYFYNNYHLGTLAVLHPNKRQNSLKLHISHSIEHPRYSN